MVLIVHRSRDSRKVQSYVGLTRMHSSRMRTARSSTVMGGLRDREPPWTENPHPLDTDPPPRRQAKASENITGGKDIPEVILPFSLKDVTFTFSLKISIFIKRWYIIARVRVFPAKTITYHNMKKSHAFELVCNVI